MSISVPLLTLQLHTRNIYQSKCGLEKVLVAPWRDFSPIIILLALDWSVNILLKPAFLKNIASVVVTRGVSMN